MIRLAFTLTLCAAPAAAEDYCSALSSVVSAVERPLFEVEPVSGRIDGFRGRLMSGDLLDAEQAEVLRHATEEAFQAASDLRSAGERLRALYAQRCPDLP